MNKKWLKGFVSRVNKSDGIVIMAVVALMLMMVIMGGAFSSIMGDWKISSPMAIHSSRATQLANSAASFALQEAKNSIETTVLTTPVTCGGRLNPETVIANDGNGGSADYWIERPDVDDDALTAGVGTLNSDDDDVNDDDDDAGGASDTFTIIATGRVTSGGVTVAQRQIKAFVDFPTGQALSAFEY